jgi:hypothetical protein
MSSIASGSHLQQGDVINSKWESSPARGIHQNQRGAVTIKGESSSERGVITIKGMKGGGGSQAHMISRIPTVKRT